jgi:hypothetical protein
MSKKSADQKPTREPMAIPVPDEEQSKDELLYLYRLERSEEFFQAKVRFRDKLARGLIPGIAPKPHQVIDTLKDDLTSQQLELLRWLAERRDMEAPLADVSRYRSKPKGTITKADEAKERKYLGRLSDKLLNMKAIVQIEIVGRQRRVRLRILSQPPA